jgi:hypothetical protein
MSTWHILCRIIAVCDDKIMCNAFLVLSRRLINELKARGTGYLFFISAFGDIGTYQIMPNKQDKVS